MNRSVIADSTFCIDCHTCEAVCSEMHRQHGLQSMSRLKAMLNEKESAPQLCHHCENAPYAVVCPVNVTTRVDRIMQSNESPRVNCKLRGIAYPFSAVEFPGSHSLGIPVNVNTSRAPLTPPTPVHVSTLFDWMPDIRAIAVKYDPCSSDGQGLACVWMCPTKALHLVDNANTARVGKRKYELAFNTDFNDLTLSQQAQSRETK